MAGPMTHALYTSDDGNDYRVRIDAGAAVIGAFGADDLSKPDLPRRYRMRFAWAEKPTTGERRKVYLSDTTAGMWLGSATTVNLQVEGTAAPVSFNVRSRIGEQRLG